MHILKHLLFLESLQIVMTGTRFNTLYVKFRLLFVIEESLFQPLFLYREKKQVLLKNSTHRTVTPWVFYNISHLWIRMQPTQSRSSRMVEFPPERLLEVHLNPFKTSRPAHTLSPFAFPPFRKSLVKLKFKSWRRHTLFSWSSLVSLKFPVNKTKPNSIYETSYILYIRVC